MASRSMMPPAVVSFIAIFVARAVVIEQLPPQDAINMLQRRAGMKSIVECDGSDCELGSSQSRTEVSTRAERLLRKGASKLSKTTSDLTYFIVGCSQSSTYGAHGSSDGTCSSTYDGQDNEGWLAAGGQMLGEWIKINLVTTYTIDNVRVVQRRCCDQCDMTTAATVSGNSAGSVAVGLFSDSNRDITSNTPGVVGNEITITTSGALVSSVCTVGFDIVTLSGTPGTPQAATPSPSASPTPSPTASPTASPTPSPTASPTATPTLAPTADPTADPTLAPTADPTAPYVLGQSNSNSCPSGSQGIATEADCQTAATALTAPYNGVSRRRMLPAGGPGGCWRGTAGKANYNPDAGAAAIGRQLICTEAATTTTTTTTTVCVDGTCTIADDPHITVFDGKLISLIQAHGKSDVGAVQMLKRFVADGETGDMWLVKSEKVSIQARYVRDDTLADDNIFVGSVAIGGEFMNGNKLIIGALDDNVTYNGNQILHDQESKFEESFIKAHRHVRARMVQHTDFINPGIDVELPEGVKLLINRQAHYINVQIKMPPAKGGQDGFCGNFNGNGDDDSLEFIEARNPRVAESESLFA